MVVQCSVSHPVYPAPFQSSAPWLYDSKGSRERASGFNLANGANVSYSFRMTPASGLLCRPRSQGSDDLGTSLRTVRRVSAPGSMTAVSSSSATLVGHGRTLDGGVQSRASLPNNWQLLYSFQPTLTTMSASASTPAPVSQQNPHQLKTIPSSSDSQASPLPSPAPTVLPVPRTSQSSPKVNLKRRRPLSDVDGPDTADLPVKKRRLRLHLITSRLSRPFSVPATHILNREAIAGLPGDGKRFVKLAAYISARRAASAAQHSTRNHNPSSVDLLRRAAVLNRIRLTVRANILATQIREFSSVVGARENMNTATAVAHHGMQLVSAARYFFPTPSTPAPPPPQHQNPAIWAAAQQYHHHTPSHVHAAPGPTPVTQHYGALLPRTPPPQGDSRTPAPPARTPHIEYSHAKLPPSPKLKASRGSRGRRLGPSPLSSSPVLRPARERDFDDDDELDNDNVSFPGSELGNRYVDEYDEDEGQDGYDLGTMFGGAPGGALTPDEIDEMEFGMLDDEPSETNEHFYEEYLDELDGIPRSPARA